MGPAVLAVLRTCRRSVPDGVGLSLRPTTDGAVEITLYPRLPAARDAQVIYQRMARETALMGWYVDVTASHLRISGWSIEALRHRAAVLHQTIRRLSTFEATALTAIRRLHHVQSEDRDAAADEIIESVCAAVSLWLWWPQRLRDLRGVQRCSPDQATQAVLTHVMDLEKAVHVVCERHVAVARLLAWAACHSMSAPGSTIRQLENSASAVQGCSSAMDQDREGCTRGPQDLPHRRRGLTERRLAGSIPNQGNSASSHGCDVGLTPSRTVHQSFPAAVVEHIDLGCHYCGADGQGTPAPARPARIPGSP